jgi:hypothetical protein
MHYDANMLRYSLVTRTELVEQRGRTRRSSAAARSPVILAQFSTRLPPELLERLRVAAPQLGMRQADIAAAALDAFLSERGFKR